MGDGIGYWILDVGYLLISQGASKVNISFIVSSDRLEQAINQLHLCFFEAYCVIDDDDVDDDDDDNIVVLGDYPSL